MCINLANEQLQNFFNEHIFLQEQEECEKEGISLDKINFTNNKPVVDVFLEVSGQRLTLSSLATILNQWMLVMFAPAAGILLTFAAIDLVRHPLGDTL